MHSGYGSYSAALFQTGFVIGTQQFQADGSCLNQLFLADTNGAQCVYSWTEVDSDMSRFAMYPKLLTHLSGELPIQTNIISFDSSIWKTFC